MRNSNDQGVVRRDARDGDLPGSGMGRRLLVNGIGINELTTITKVMATSRSFYCAEPPRRRGTSVSAWGRRIGRCCAGHGAAGDGRGAGPAASKRPSGTITSDAQDVLATPRGRW